MSSIGRSSNNKVMEKEKQEEEIFKPWGASTGTLSRRIIGASASMLRKYKKSLEEGQIDLETSKVLFLGDSCVGKTSLQKYFREQGFSAKYDITHGNEKHHVETAAVTDTWEDVKDPENEQQYAASFATVQMTDNSASQADDHGSSFDQHSKLVFGLLCLCVAFASFPFGLCSLKIIGCLFSTILFSGNLPLGIRFGEGTALSMFCSYACIEILYADSNMQQRMDNPDSLLEFQRGILCCGLVIGFVLGFGCRAGTSLVFSFVCLKSQGSILRFFQIVLAMLYEWCIDFKQASTVFLISSIALTVCTKLCQEKINTKKICLQLVVSNFATALICEMIKGGKYLNLLSEKTTVITLIGVGDASAIFLCKTASKYLMYWICQFYICLLTIAIIVCFYSSSFHHYVIILLNVFFSAMLEYTTGMVIGRPLAKVCDIHFLVRRILGFILGALMVYFMKWTVAFPPGEFILDQVLSVGIVVAFELWGFWQVKQAMADGIDLTKIRLAKSKYENGVSGMRIKFVLIDCGGQEEYHYFHHLFIPKNAVYIIVFNFEDASCKNPKNSMKLRKQFIKLRYWLNCVLAHICLPDDENYKNHRPIFIVGTHRNSVDKEVRQTISQELTHLFEREGIDKYISWNEDTLVFEVENSGQCKRDTQGNQLRKQIAKAASKKQKTTIKWLKFAKVMQSLPPIITNSELKDAVIEKDVITNENEFENFVKYFNDRGDIYCASDSSDCQTGFVVLRHGQSWFVDLFLEILIMIERKENKKGILNENTMNQAIYLRIETLSKHQPMPPEKTKHLKDICRKLLEESNLIVKVTGSPFYLVPFQLEKASQKDKYNLWKYLTRKEITFGFDFEEFEPKPIFWRLTSTLLKMSGDKDFRKRNFRQTVYSDFAVFTEPSTRIRYKLEMKSIITQNVILFTTLTDTNLPVGAIEQQTFKVFAGLHQKLKNICTESFPGQKYAVGLVCQIQDEHTCLWKEKGHVHMYHLGDNKSGFKLFDNIPKGISAVCKCGAASKMKIYVYFGKTPQETERLREKLRKNWTRIEADLDPSFILSPLYENGVLDDDDMEYIPSIRARKNKCKKLLHCLRKCSPEKEPMRHFCNALRDQYPHLARLLEPSPETARP